MQKFERYRPKKKTAPFPCVTIRPLAIGFNRHCFPAFQKKPFVELFYDRSSKTIAVKPYHIETAYTVKVGGKQEKGVLQVICMGFMKENDIAVYLKLDPISTIKSKRFKAFWDEKQKWFLIDLKGDDI